MICDGVATIFGPEGPCHVEAIVSQARNIPMISYVSFSVLSPPPPPPSLLSHGFIFSHTHTHTNPNWMRNECLCFRNVRIIWHLRSRHSHVQNHQTLKWDICIIYVCTKYENVLNSFSQKIFVYRWRNRLYRYFITTDGKNFQLFTRNFGQQLQIP